MRSFGRHLLALGLLSAMGWHGQAQAQGNCQNTAQFPGGIILIQNTGLVQTVSTGIWLQEFTHFGGALAGATYEFTITGNGYITVREGLVGGPVIAQGLSSVQATTTTTADLFVHYNVNALCDQVVGAQTSTVRLLLDCEFPSVSFSTSANCDDLEYFVTVNVTDLGDATTVDITNSGGVAPTTNVGVGSYQIGPFVTLVGVTVTVVHDSDPLCSVTSPILQNPLCAIPIVCGAPALEETYCYVANDDQAWSYAADGSGTLRLRFLRGTIESNSFDRIRIYDGGDNLAPLLFSHTNTATYNLGPVGSAVLSTIQNFYGVEVFSTSGSLYMEMESDGSVQCSTSANYDPWEWEVVCLDCTIPIVTVEVVDDCDNNSFNLVVDVISTGDGATVNLVYIVDGIEDIIDGVGVGENILGPFTINDIVDLVVEHETNSLCTLELGEYTDTGNCPNLIECGAPALQQNYCYGNNEATTWLYSAVGTGTLRLSFTGGSIQSSTFDQLSIHDGVDNSGPILWSHTATITQQLNGIEVTTNTGNLFMTMASNATVSCASGAHTTWQWNVVCLDCNIPEATFTVVDDCPNNEFSIPVTVTSLGDGAFVNLVYTVNGGAPVTIPEVGVGETVLGPFTINDVVNLVMEHEDNFLCHVEFGDISDTDTCPNLIVCGAPALEETYCYVANDQQDWLYSAVGSGTLRLRFLRGTIESSTFDRIRIYDGTDDTGALLFSHTNTLTYNLGPVGSAILSAVQNFYGVEVYSTTGSIYMEMESDGSVQCSTSTNYDPWEWEVVCLDCTIPVAVTTVVDDCDNEEFSILVDVTSAGDGATVTLIYTVDGGNEVELTGVDPGETVLGPFPFDAVVAVTLAHESNELCNISLGNFTDTGLCPDLIQCGEPAQQSTYCYTANDNTSWGYEIVGTGTLRLTFLRGTIQSSTNDQLRIYDGPDATGTLLFQHTNTIVSNLGPVGSAVNNTFTTYYGVQVFSTTGTLFMEVTSDGFTQCATTTTYDPFLWEVVCLDCELPLVTAFADQNCSDSTFVVPVSITSTGSGATVDIVSIVNGGAPQTLAGIGTGTTELGPYPFGTVVNVTVEHESNELCNVPLGNFTNPPICPVIICGAQVLEETYCYGANEDIAWSYELPGSSGTLHLTFLRGTIESSTWDRLRIYDGPDNTGALLFSHTNTLTYNLGPIGSAINNTINNFYGVDVVSTTGRLYMELESDGIIHCDGSTTYDPFEWEVYCVGCQAPGISYNMVENCFDRSYMAEVIVTAAPPTEGLLIENLTTGETITATAVGVYEFGPYAQDAISAFEIIGLDNPGCSFFSEEMTYPSADCVIRTCGFDNFEYCYGNNEDRWYTFQADAGVPITIGFLEGQMLAGDFIVIYNGANENAAVIYQGNNSGNLTGFAVNSQNPANTLTLRIQSNASGSCADGQATIPLRWYVACGAVGIEEANEGGFSLYPNPTNGLLYIDLGGEDHGRVQVRVLDMSGRAVIDQQIVARGGDLNTVNMEGLMSGQYMVQLMTEDWIRTQRVQVVR